MVKRHRIKPLDFEDSGPDLDPAWIDRIQHTLINWFERSSRPMPWRVDRSPYRVLVSEMMLVQTTVAAVTPYFERFVARFPSFAALAEADPDEVLKLWEGLGYYRRARQLQEAARTVMRDHQGEMPVDLVQIQSLPGVGRYIAGAISTFALDRTAPILEANTQRVAARWLAWRGELRAPQSQARFWRLAERVVPSENAGTFNQAFMELGGVVCTPRTPLCLVCPVADDCRARSLGLQDSLPVVAAKLPPKLSTEACAIVERDGRRLFVRRGPGRLWESFWEFPTVHVAGADPAARSFEKPLALAEAIRRLSEVRAEVGPIAKAITYSVTTHKVTLQAHLGRFIEGEPRPGHGMTEAAWLGPEDLSGKSLSSPTRRLLTWLGRDD